MKTADELLGSLFQLPHQHPSHGSANRNAQGLKNNFSRERFLKSWKLFFNQNSALRSKNLQKCIFWIWWIIEGKLWDEERKQRWRSKGSKQGEIRISSSSVTVLCLELLHILLRRQSFYKARKSTWPTMKNALFERPTSTNIINKMSMPVLMEMKVFIHKVAAMNSNNNFIWSLFTWTFEKRKAVINKSFQSIFTLSCRMWLCFTTHKGIFAFHCRADRKVPWASFHNLLKNKFSAPSSFEVDEETFLC